MRKIFYSLPLSMLFPVLMFAQKPVQKITPTGPVTIMTQQGPKVVSTVRGKLPPKRTQPQKVSKKKVAATKAVDIYKDYLKVKRTVKSGMGRQKDREIFIYYPPAQINESPRRQMKPQGYFATVTLNSQSDVNNFNTMYPSCTSVGTLTIDGSTINDISNLAAITDAAMISVKNTSLTNLSALSTLTTITDSLVLENNASLTSIGLSSVSTLGGLILRNLSSLATVDAFSNSLVSVAHDIIIENVPVTSLSGISALTSLGGDLSLKNTQLTTAGQMNGLTTIGYLYLEDNSLMTTIGMTNLQKLDGFIIQNMPLMTSLGPLTQNLTQTNLGTVWIGIMPAMTDISGLSSITSVANIFIYGNDQLQDLQGLDNIDDAPYGIMFYNNAILDDITALSQITTVANGKMEVSFCNNLTSLAGLGGITEADALWITNNNSLTDLNALNAGLVIHNINGDDLQITDNPNLSLCAVPAICNYLSSGNAVDPQIYGNTGDCPDLTAVLSGCGTSGSGTIITWGGSVSDDWTDPANWIPNQVPDAGSVVIIPGGTDYDPTAYDNISIGGLKMNGSTLYMGGYDLTVTDTFQIQSAYIDYANDIIAQNVKFPIITSSYISAYSFQITNFTDSANIYLNSFDGDITISDHSSRTGRVYTFGNDFQANLTYTNNGTAENNYLANGITDADYIYGDLEINNNSTGTLYIAIGRGQPLVVEGNVTITEANPATTKLERITFSGSSNQQLTVPDPLMVQMGPFLTQIVPYSVDSMYFSKEYQSSLVLNKPFTVNKYLLMGSGEGSIKSSDANILQIADNCVVMDADPVNGSFVEGPVSKIGDDAFTYPLGYIEPAAGRTGNQAGLRKKSSYGYFKAPLSISAPSSSSDEVIAEYKRQNPVSAGYDTTQHQPGVGHILTNEYWNLQNNSGDNISVTLTYDDVHISESFTPSSLKLGRWDGSQWVALGGTNVTGDNSRGTVTSATAFDASGPLVLTTNIARNPVVTITYPNDTTFCKGSTLWVHFTLDTAAIQGSVFSVELSDEHGVFNATNTVLNSKTTFNSDSIDIMIPGNLVVDSSYKIRVVSDVQSLVSVNTPVIIPVTGPQMNITISGPDSLCMDAGVAKYYLSAHEPGVTYTWNVTNGTFTTNVDTAFVTFTASGATTVKVTPSNQCGNGVIASYNVYVKPGTPTATPVLTNVGRWLHVSAADAAQHVTEYKWFRDGVLMNGVAGLSYYASEAGTFTVQYANDCGDGPASTAINFAAASIPQTITFDSIPDKVFNDEPFSIPATSSAGLPLQFELVSGPGNITAGVFTITQTGTVVIRVTQQGDNVFDTAAPVTRSFVINKAPQTITFDSIPDFIFKGYSQYLYPGATATSGLQLNYQSSATNITLYPNSNYIRIDSLGSVTLTATQAGNANYLPATPVMRTFCVRVDKINPITGPQYVCPGQAVVYRTNKIAGLTYFWRLAGGSTFPSTADTAEVTFGSAGTYQLVVSATGPCGPATPTDTLTVTVLDGVTVPGAASNMLPANGSVDQKLPLVLSWLPGENALSYDLYLWQDGSSKPATPFAANLTAISYTLPRNAALIYDQIYHWQVVSKTGCLQTNSPEQTFRLRKAPDLNVTQVLAPVTANAGQTITINWTVKNTGAGNTLTNESWTDAVFLSFDTMPNFLIATTSDIAWNALTFPIKPLLIGTKTNVSALNAGEEYTNSINFTLPVSYSAPMYVYVITGYPNTASTPPQMDFSNDTSRTDNAIDVIPAPTPDLRVDTVLVPATTFSGSIINVTYKVNNYGALTPSNKVWSDKIYISKSPLFNKQSATLLKFAHYGNKMHYPADDAIVSQINQLQEDSAVTKSVQVLIPDFISGTWFIHVVANADQALYEGALANNNENNSSIQIILTPTPQFSISNINLPLTTMSNTQSTGLNWNMHNLGFYDKIEEDKGFYGRDEGICYFKYKETDDEHHIGSYEFDSLSWGSSYWVDKVYLSTDPGGLNTGTAIYLGQATKGIKNLGWSVSNQITQGTYHCSWPVRHPEVPGGTTNNVLRPGSNHSNHLNFKVPANLPEGDYYIYVQTNATKSVFTYPDTPVIGRSGKITIVNPDLVVSAITVPATITGGVPYNIDYTITNNTSGGVYGTKRTDKVYLSNSSVFDELTATLIGTATYTEDVLSGQPVTHTLLDTLPNGASGTKYFFVKTNADSAFLESDFGNNVSAAASSNVATAPLVDLTVPQVIVPANATAPGTVQVKYQIQNNGGNPANGLSKDSIYMVCNPVFSYEDAVFVGVRENTRAIAAGSNAWDSVSVSIPKQAYLLNDCFSKANTSNAYFFVKVNASKALYEAADTTNNVGGSSLVTLTNINIDLVVTDVNLDTNLLVGRPYALQYFVANIGNGSLVSGRHYDSLYLSTDSIFDASVLGIRYYDARSTIPAGDTVVHTNSLIVPKIAAGDYYVFVKLNSTDALPTEVNIANNTGLMRNASGKAIQVHVTVPLLPDLQSEVLEAPVSVAIGQPVKVKYRVSNSGDGITYSTYNNSWGDELWLSKSAKPVYGDTRLSLRNHVGNLNVGEFYDDSVSVTISMNTPAGNYLLVTNTDNSNLVIEKNDTNNLGLIPITVYIPAPSDLIVSNISAPDTVYLGETINGLEWSIQNISANASEGVSTDGVYISKNTVFDSTAKLLGIKEKNHPLSPLASDTLTLSPLIDNVTEGNYNIIVRTDILNNIYETDKTNNENVTQQPVYVAVKELPMNVNLPDALTTAKYYKLHIPDSLLGATVLLTLKTEDSLTRVNEMYVGGGYIPSVLKSDYKFNTPNYGNQRILISDITDSVYYISIRCVTPDPGTQNISLNATVLPFSIVEVDANRGGNAGNVTVKITGSLFTDSMTAKLTNGATTINATKVYFVNSTQVYATFPLLAQPIAVYDLTLVKTDLSETTLTNGFSVVSPDNGGLYSGGGVNTGQTGYGTEPGCDPGSPAGKNSQLVTEIIVNKYLLAGIPFTLEINYSNPTNMDIPVQSMILYNDRNLPMSLVPGNYNNTSGLLYVEFSETDGPPGVLRAGSSGSITIYGRVPATAEGHTIVKFNLK